MGQVTVLQLRESNTLVFKADKNKKYLYINWLVTLLLISKEIFEQNQFVQEKISDYWAMLKPLVEINILCLPEEWQ